MQIAAFETIPTEEIYEKWTDVVGQPINDNFEAIGFEHHLLLDNFGTLGVIFACFPFLYAVYFCISPCKGIYCCRKTAKKLRV